MPIFISNVSESSAQTNRPIICWRSSFNQTDVINAPLAITGVNPTNVWASDTYAKWEAENGGGSSAYAGLIFDVDLSYGNIDYYGIAGHNLGTVGATYSWQHLNVDGVTWENITTPRIVSDDRAIIDYTDSIAPYDSRVRLYISIPSGKTVRISHIKIGQVLQLYMPIWGGVVPAGMDERVEKISSKSYSGNYLGSVLVSRGSSFSIEQKNNPVSHIRSSEIQNFFRHANLLEKIQLGPVETFFYAWRPTTHPLEVQYCCKVNDFNPPKNDTGTVDGGLMSWSISGDAYK